MRTSKNQKTREGFPPYVASLKQAVAELLANGHACDVAHLQRAKHERPAGAFKGTRVYFVASLFEWLETNPFEAPLPDAPEDEEALEPKEILERRKLREQFLTARRVRLTGDGKFIPRAEVERDLARIGAATRQSLQRLLGDVPSLEGKDAADLSVYLKDKIDAICAELHDSASALYA